MTSPGTVGRGETECAEGMIDQDAQNITSPPVPPEATVPLKSTENMDATNPYWQNPIMPSAPSVSPLPTVPGDVNIPNTIPGVQTDGNTPLL